MPGTGWVERFAFLSVTPQLGSVGRCWCPHFKLLRQKINPCLESFFNRVLRLNHENVFKAVMSQMPLSERVDRLQGEFVSPEYGKHGAIIKP